MLTRPIRLAVVGLFVVVVGAVVLRLVLAPSSASWTDEGQFWVTLIGVLVTLGAVLVALFGPAWQAARRRPKLSLSVDYNATMWAPGSSNQASTFWLRLANARGRDTAKDVEVFASMIAETPEHESPSGVAYSIPAEDEPLSFGTRMSGNATERRVSVPAGHARWVAFADAGEPGEVASAAGLNLDTIFRIAWNSGAENVQPRARLRVDAPEAPIVPWLEFGVMYGVELVVTGSNFDALRFRGEFGTKRHRDEDLGEGFWCGWETEPRPVGEAVPLLVDEVMR